MTYTVMKLIPVSLQPEGVNLRYCKLGLFNPKEFTVWNLYDSELQRYSDYKMRVLSDSIPLKDISDSYIQACNKYYRVLYQGNLIPYLYSF